MSGVRGLFGMLFIVVCLGVLGIGGYLLLHDLEGPTITMEPDTGRVSPTQDIHLTLSDAKSNIRSVVVSIRKNNQSLLVFEHGFTEPREQQAVTFNLSKVGLRDGEFELEVTAYDTTFAGFGKGNSTTRVWPMVLDTQAPKIRMKTTSPSLRRGSITVIAYTLSEPVAQTGVWVKDRFFPAHRQANGQYYCFFAFPIDVPKNEFAPEVAAVDLAGNEARSRVIVHAVDRAYRSDTLNISERFLEKKMPDFETLIPDAKNHLDRYVRVNNEVRLANEARLREVGKQTSPTMLWNGVFSRLPGSAVRANFGDHRSYMHNGVKIDEQTHMGIDFASTAQAPVPAANNGTVVLAENLGIFGELVVIDHGLGFQSLYSHLSEIHVAVGDSVKKGDTIGRTGTTGLAGGDHLHFGLALCGVQVQPIDWLDPNWIKNTITSRLEDAAK